jgi:Domain of unknown function (DUF5615)
MANFYADEQFPKDTTIALRALGHDVLTVQEAGNANQKIPDRKAGRKPLTSGMDALACRGFSRLEAIPRL